MSWFDAATSEWQTSLVSGTPAPGGPRFFQRAEIRRPVVGDFGDVTLGDPTVVDASVWPRRMKQVTADGELFQITAMGFMPSGTDVRLRDRITLQGRWAGPEYEVLNVVSGFDDRGVTNHVGVELRNVDG